MKHSFVRNRFVARRDLAFRDKARKLPRKRAESSVGSRMVFEYSHGAPSYPTDVLPDGNQTRLKTASGIRTAVYNALNGRWTGRDKWGESVDFNIFAYVHNIPDYMFDIKGNSLQSMQKCACDACQNKLKENISPYMDEINVLKMVLCILLNKRALERIRMAYSRVFINSTRAKLLTRNSSNPYYFQL